jgi:hypothetical protein
VEAVVVLERRDEEVVVANGVVDGVERTMDEVAFCEREEVKDEAVVEDGSEVSNKLVVVEIRLTNELLDVEKPETVEEEVRVAPVVLVPFKMVDSVEAVEADSEDATVVCEVFEVVDSDEMRSVVELDTILELEALALENWYKLNPFGPPQIWLELPAQVNEQRPSVATTAPGMIVLPQ